MCVYVCVCVCVCAIVYIIMIWTARIPSLFHSFAIRPYEPYPWVNPLDGTKRSHRIEECNIFFVGQHCNVHDRRSIGERC